MAKLSDVLGQRSIYVADVALFALGSLLVASTPNFGMLLVGRAVQGLGAGGIFPVADAGPSYVHSNVQHPRSEA